MDDDPSSLASRAFLIAASSLWKYGVIVVALLCAESFCAAMEAGLFALSRTQARQLAERGERSFQIALELLEDPRGLLATTLAASTFFLLAAEAVATHVAISMPALAWLPLLAVPFFAITFGDVIPTLYALQKPEPVVRIGAPVAFALHMLMNPCVSLARRLFANPIEEGGLAEAIPQASLTKEDIRTVLAVAEEQGGIADHKREMIHSAMEFDNKRVREIMVPRDEVVALRASDTIEQALRTIIECQHARVPVYEESPTQFTGVVYAKDLIPFVREGRMMRPAREAARSPYFISEQMQIRELLQDLQQRRRLMAIVVAADGTSEGIVTMEDLLEEIVGEIMDEYDVDASQPQPVTKRERIS